MAKYKAIDLFAGIGGIRMGFEQAFGDDIETVFASEWSKFARQTYRANFETPSEIAGDITQVDACDIPDFDILLAGFPCQPFSLAGVSKKNSLGRKHGFEDETQGTLFFDIARIIEAKRPAAFMLENVKNLKSHDRGNTWRVIERTLAEDLGYHIHPMILDAADWTCQHRERIYIVGFRDDLPFDWADLERDRVTGCVADILAEDAAGGYTLSDHMWGYLQGYAEKHRAKGHGFGFGLVSPSSPKTRTLSARYHKDGSEILLDQGNGANPRMLTERECARLQGFPDSFEIPVSKTQAYRQFGNSVSVPVVRAVARLVKKALDTFPDPQIAAQSGSHGGAAVEKTPSEAERQRAGQPLPRRHATALKSGT